MFAHFFFREGKMSDLSYPRRGKYPTPRFMEGQMSGEGKCPRVAKMCYTHRNDASQLNCIVGKAKFKNIEFETK